MDKKYIVTLADEYALVHKLTVPVTINGKHTAWMQTDINLTPYTEPDLEQVRKEAYERGWKEAEDHYDDGYSDGYAAGLDDAWEAARKLVLGDINVIVSVFDTASRSIIIRDLTAAEAIEKLRAFEQKQEQDAEIKVGDEVISPDGKGVVTEINERIVRIMYSNGSGYVTQLEELTITGRHFPEIAAVLEKMREEQDG